MKGKFVNCFELMKYPKFCTESVKPEIYKKKKNVGKLTEEDCNRFAPDAQETGLV